MKIPRELPHFRGKTALVLVTGKQDAVFYTIKEDTIRHIDRFKVPKPRYSDNEGHFRMRGKGMTMRGGSPTEYHNASTMAVRDFMKEFRTKIRGLKSDTVDAVYILSPSQVKNYVLEALPQSLKGKVKFIIEGNYYRHPPLVIVERIRQQAYPAPQFINNEARKILDEAEQAKAAARTHAHRQAHA